MAYAHAGFDALTTASARLAELNLHIGEVRLEMGPDTASRDHSISRTGLTAYLEALDRRRRELETEASRESGSGILAGRFVRAV